MSNIKTASSGITGLFVLPDSPYAFPDGISILIFPFSLIELKDFPREVLKSERRER